MIKKSFMLAAAISLGALTTTGYAVPLKEETVLLSEQSQAEQSSIQERLNLLEQAIIPTTPEETAETWARAVQLRNGALQYALGTKDVQDSARMTFEHYHWVTGVSSPWVETYQILSKEEKDDQSIEFLVEFDLVTSFGQAGKDRAVLTVTQQGEQWFVSGIAPASEKAIGIWNTPESINEGNIEIVMEDMELYENTRGLQLTLPKDVMSKIDIQESTCTNEEGNPPCTFFYYKDGKGKKDVLLISVIYLTEKQEQSNYYQEHPFLKKGSDTFHFISQSEHPYGESAESEEGKEWSYLLNVIEKRLQF